MVAGILLTARVAEQSAEAMRTIAAVSGVSIELALFPDDDGPITAAGLAGMEMAYASPDIFEDGRTAWLFLDAMQRAPDLLHVVFIGRRELPNALLEHVYADELLEVLAGGLRPRV